jgi:arylsulfatase A-like enzyme
VILTGKHSHLNGVTDNAKRFDGEQQTVSKLLQSAGYQTAMIGKWHLKTDPTGFDHWEVLPGQGSYYNPDFKTAEGKQRYTGYVTDIITDLALDWLEEGRRKERPFLLMCQHKAPHRNWMPGPKYLTLYDDVEIPEPPTLFDDWTTGRASPAARNEMSLAGHFYPAYDLKISPPEEGTTDERHWNNMMKRMTDEQKEAWHAAYGPKNEAFRKANLEGKDLLRWRYQRYIKDYLRCIASVDENIGRLLDYLDSKGLSNNTVVMYSSDQGFYLGDHGWFDKRWMYEESLRMPLVMRWLGRIRGGTRVKQLVQNIDFAPTFLSAAGEDTPGDMQGTSVLPLLAGDPAVEWRKSIYYHYYEHPGVHNVARHYGVRTARHKLIYYYETDEWELFDLEQDPHEMNSVYGDPAYANTTAELKKELKRLRKHYGDDTGKAF